LGGRGGARVIRLKIPKKENMGRYETSKNCRSKKLKEEGEEKLTGKQKESLGGIGW